MNPYPPRFEELLADLPADAMVLDAGSGGRAHDDPRVRTLDLYAPADFHEDVTALPFSDARFDLILSQAVLEHVPDPDAAVSEMLRVLKPGGRIYCEAAFIQPVHAAPSHYFNITGPGMAWLFRDADIEAQGTVNSLADMFGWLFEAVNFTPPRGLLAEMAHIHDGLELASSGVWIEATKRGEQR